MEYLWVWFHELQRGRSYNGMGPNPISFTELEAWARLTDRVLSAWEVQALKDIDDCWVQSRIEASSQE